MSFEDYAPGFESHPLLYAKSSKCEFWLTKVKFLRACSIGFGCIYGPREG